jgi:hypothetical protein
MVGKGETRFTAGLFLLAVAAVQWIHTIIREIFLRDGRHTAWTKGLAAEPNLLLLLIV